MGQPLTRVPCWAFQRPKTTDGHRRNAAVFLHRAPAKSPRGLRAPPLPDLEPDSKAYALAKRRMPS